MEILNILNSAANQIASEKKAEFGDILKKDFDEGLKAYKETWNQMLSEIAVSVHTNGLGPVFSKVSSEGLATMIATACLLKDEQYWAALQEQWPAPLKQWKEIKDDTDGKAAIEAVRVKAFQAHIYQVSPEARLEWLTLSNAEQIAALAWFVVVRKKLGAQVARVMK